MNQAVDFSHLRRDSIAYLCPLINMTSVYNQRSQDACAKWMFQQGYISEDPAKDKEAKPETKEKKD
jgi:hypothetical protein